jgi:hypothetical protein
MPYLPIPQWLAKRLSRFQHRKKKDITKSVLKKYFLVLILFQIVLISIILYNFYSINSFSVKVNVYVDETKHTLSLMSEAICYGMGMGNLREMSSNGTNILLNCTIGAVEIHANNNQLEMPCDTVINGKCYTDTLKTIERLQNGTLEDVYR